MADGTAWKRTGRLGGSVACRGKGFQWLEATGTNHEVRQSLGSTVHRPIAAPALSFLSCPVHSALHLHLHLQLPHAEPLKKKDRKD